MTEIVKTLKKSTLAIILVIGLIFVQVACDLALPQYTSDIVNVGVQQSGIKDSVPEVIRSSQLDKIILLASAEEGQIIHNDYKLISKDSLSAEEYKKYVKDYPLLKSEDLYVLKDIDKEERARLKDNLATLLIMVSSLEKDDKVSQQIKSGIVAQAPNLADLDLFVIFRMMNTEQLSLITAKMNEQYSKLDDSLINQMGIAVVKSEYDIIGVNVEAMQINYIVIIGLMMLGVALIGVLAVIIVTYLAAKIGAALARDLRAKVVKKIMAFSNKEYNDFSTASLITRSTNDIQQIQMLAIMMLRMLIYAPILGVGAFLKVSGNEMSWVIGIAVLAIMVLIIVLFAVVIPKFQKIQKLVDKLNLVSREIVTGIPVIRAFANEKYEEEKFDKVNYDLTKVSLFVNRVMAMMMPVMMFIMNGVCVLIIWVGADKINDGTIQVGTLMAFMTYTIQIIMAFLFLAMLSIILPRAWVSVKRIVEVFNKKIILTDKDKTVNFNPRVKGVIEFKDVAFKYPDAEEEVLEDISFNIMPRTTTAFIGATGSGKSTLVNLIPRFFDVTKGTVLVDGKDVRDVKQSDLRSKIGYCPQKGYLFSGSIKSNISFGNSKASEAEIKKAARIAQAANFIEKKKDKYESDVAQGGINLSGGQQQRLAIARAIAKNPEIYIFDDSFSALDYKTDMKLRKALAKEIKGSTILIVTQRISTVLNADQIIVLDEGKIVGMGTHQDLMSSCDVYQEIALSQLSEEELQHV